MIALNVYSLKHEINELYSFFGLGLKFAMWWWDKDDNKNQKQI